MKASVGKSLFLIVFSNFKVSVKYVYVFPDITLPEGTNDQAGQDNFNAAKATADQTRTTVYNDLQAYDWNAYQASTGLELQDGNVDNYNLGQVEAYCSENGAVVRKCNDADLNCGKESCPCTKTEGTVTKCSKCKSSFFYILFAFKTSQSWLINFIWTVEPPPNGHFVLTVTISISGLSGHVSYYLHVSTITSNLPLLFIPIQHANLVMEILIASVNTTQYG